MSAQRKKEGEGREIERQTDRDGCGSGAATRDRGLGMMDIRLFPRTLSLSQEDLVRFAQNLLNQRRPCSSV